MWANIDKVKKAAEQIEKIEEIEVFQRRGCS